jgi:insulysin
VDKKKYYTYTHSSGLEVIIIQDVNVRVAGAVMSVNSGVKNEGKDIYGLAHYCEHMLFLGSKKFDKPTYFVDFITQHNGKFNGYTDFDTTGFFFKINTDKFRHGLEIFSRFFIDPLFSLEYVEKEVNSVNSEYERNIQLDSKRKEMVLRDISDENSLFHRFSTGNTETLWNYTKNNKIDLRERVMEYYKINYRPDNMKLVVYGDQTIDSYKNMVEDMFIEMTKRSEPYDPATLGKWTKPTPWDKNNIGKLVLFKTINNHHELDITFLIDDVFEALPENLGLYFKVLFNYRGKGSLEDVLRRKGYVAGIKSNIRRTYEGFSFFKMKGYITKHGIRNLDKVLSVIFNYVKFVREKALNKQLYDYIKRIFDVSFFFNNRKKKLMKYLKSMSMIVWRYPKKYYFTQHKILAKFNKEKIEKFGKQLSLDNAVIIIGNREFTPNLIKKFPKFVDGIKEDNLNQDNILNKKDPFYFTIYGQYQLNKDFVKNIEDESKSDLKENKLKLVSNKKKLPKRISLIKSCPSDEKAKCIKEYRSDAKDLTPKLVKQTKHFELWHKRDRSYFVTKTNLFIKFIFDIDVNNPKYATKMRLLIYALNHYMRNFFFDESLRQTSFHLNASANGFSAKIFSFTETLNDSSISFFKKMKKLKLGKSEFELIKDEMRNHIKAQMNLVPALRAYVNFFTLILKDYVHNKKILIELEKLSLKDFQGFFDHLFNTMYVNSFFHGTIDEKSSIELFGKIFDILSGGKPVKLIKKHSLKHYNNLHADLSGYFIFRERLKKSYNINHAIMNFYQLGQENVKNIFMANMIKALCGYIYFTQLRIKEQLGYTARAKIFSEGNVIYYMILVQGSKKTPDYMDLRIENVIEMMRKRIEDSPDRKFEKIKNILANRIGKKDKNIKARTFR